MLQIRISGNTVIVLSDIQKTDNTTYIQMEEAYKGWRYVNTLLDYMFDEAKNVVKIM